MHQLRHDRLRGSLGQGSEFPHSAGHWHSGQRKIQETGFSLSEVKNDIFFHRVAVNYNQLSNSPQYDAAKVRSDVIIRQPYGKEICIVIKLSTLVETLPNKIFLTPGGVIVASHGPNVDDYDKRLVIPANIFHAVQISTQANKSSGASYLLNGFSKKEWSEQATQILAQLSIPDISIQEIKSAHQYVKGLTATSLDEGFTSESNTNFPLLPCQRRDYHEVHECERSH